MPEPSNRSQRLDRAIADLLAQAPEVEAAAVVSFDGLPMASALPATMDEDRVAAMSAALLSLGERAAEGLGRGGLNQVYIEGEAGTVYLVSAEDEAVLVAVASADAKVGMMLYEVRRAASAVAAVLRADDAPAFIDEPVPTEAEYEAAAYDATYGYDETHAEPAPVPEPAVAYDDHAANVDVFVKPMPDYPVTDEAVPAYTPSTADSTWTSHLPSAAAEPPAWS